MQAIELLKNYKKILDPELKKYFDRKIKQSRRVDPLAGEAVKMIADFTLASGKRIRPAMVYYGYLASGGKDGPEIIEASMAIELVHSFLLIHDDIIDRDDMRHGVPTLHERYRKIGQRIAPKKNAEHFGNSMAMIAGDMAAAMANEIMFNAKFPPELIIRALDKLQDIVYVTIPGEMLDVILEMKGKATEKEILRMHEGKTSRYTFEGPLHLGAILSGNGGENNLKAFTDYSLPLGKAFQVKDDILGVFGEEKKLGKPVGSDVIEGKQTILVLKALEKGSGNQKNIIKKCLGKKDLSKKELEEFRKVIIDTGSLGYSEDLAKKFAGDSLCALDQIGARNPEANDFLLGIARYMVEREA
jgi:geranylgeranyl diphosphate synthase, type I